MNIFYCLMCGNKIDLHSYCNRITCSGKCRTKLHLYHQRRIQRDIRLGKRKGGEAIEDTPKALHNTNTQGDLDSYTLNLADDNQKFISCEDVERLVNSEDLELQLEETPSGKGKVILWNMQTRKT